MEITSEDKRCALVTGANKGIGLEICRQLLSNGIRVILTARDEKKGIQALKSLQSSQYTRDLVFHQLDLKDPASISALARFVSTTFGKLDILVNNAAEAGADLDAEALMSVTEGGGFLQVDDKRAEMFKGIIKQTYEMSEQCIKTNYYGTRAVTEALLPLLQISSSARIVTVSSNYGELENIHNEKVKAELEKIDSLTDEKIDTIVQQFLKDFKEDNLQANGWPLTVSAYKVSKVAINAYSRLVAKKYPRILVNCVHPGYVKTDITGNTGLLTPEEGARAPVMVSLLPDGGPSGVYFSQMKPSAF